MNALFVKLLNMSITASILVSVVMILRLLFKDSPKKYICILWSFVALRLICPLSISSATSVFNLINIGANSTGQIEYFEYQIVDNQPTMTYEVSNSLDDDYSPASITWRTVSRTIYLPYLTAIWMLGIVIMVANMIFFYTKLERLVSASFEEERGIFVCDDISSPFVLGIISPKIYLPSGLDEEAKSNVLAHERMHLKRHDHWWKPLGYVLLSVYWFNPIIWIAYLLLCRDIEAACDEEVIENMDKIGVISYAQSLLKCASQRRMITACPIAFGETNVKGRIKNILNYKKPAFWISYVTVAVCIFSAVCLLTDSKKKDLDVPARYYEIVDNPEISCDYGCYVGHDEIDYASTNNGNCNVYAWTDGIVQVTGYNEVDGYYLVLKHSGDLESGYTHLNELPMLFVGQEIAGGEIIGQIGETGTAIGPHVGFFIKINGEKVNPNEYSFK